MKQSKFILPIIIPPTVSPAQTPAPKNAQNSNIIPILWSEWIILDKINILHTINAIVNNIPIVIGT